MEGELDNFLPMTLEKLHFFDGVFWMLVGVVADFWTWSEACFEGVEGKEGTSRDDWNLMSLTVSRFDLLDVGGSSAWDATMVGV